MKQLTSRWIALVVITALTLVVAWMIISPFINVLLWAIVITVLAAPLNNALRRKGLNANLCAALTLVAVVVVVVLPVTFIVTTLVGRIDETVQALQAMLNAIADPQSAPAKWLSQYIPDLPRYLEAAAGPSTQPTTAQAVAATQPAQPEGIALVIRQYSGAIASQTASLLSKGVIAAVQFLLVLFTSYYMLRDGGQLMVGVREMLPLDRKQTDLLVNNIEMIISASLKGTIFIAAVQAILGGLAFWILGVPSALLWGIIMFFMAMVPVLGSSIVWVPAALYLLIAGSPVKAVILVIWGAGVIGMMDNLLRPVLVGSKTRMHELTVFFSVLGGLQVFGPVGIIIGPIVIALAMGLLKIFHEVSDSHETAVASAE